MWKYRNVSYDDLPPWTRPWANPEDWTGGPAGYKNSLPEWWVHREGSDFRAFYKYHAFRNPANGLRSFEALDLDIKQDEVRYKTPFYCRFYEPWYMRREHPERRTYYYIAWQGHRAGVKFVHHWNNDRHFVFKFGWRIEPRDAHEQIDPDGIRHRDAGFASKLLPYRKG